MAPLLQPINFFYSVAAHASTENEKLRCESVRHVLVAVDVLLLTCKKKRKKESNYTRHGDEREGWCQECEARVEKHDRMNEPCEWTML